MSLQVTVFSSLNRAFSSQLLGLIGLASVPFIIFVLVALVLLVSVMLPLRVLFFGSKVFVRQPFPFPPFFQNCRLCRRPLPSMSPPVASLYPHAWRTRTLSFDVNGFTSVLSSSPAHPLELGLFNERLLIELLFRRALTISTVVLTWRSGLRRLASR